MHRKDIIEISDCIQIRALDPAMACIVLYLISYPYPPIAIHPFECKEEDLEPITS